MSEKILTSKKSDAKVQQAVAQLDNLPIFSTPWELICTLSQIKLEGDSL